MGAIDGFRFSLLDISRDHPFRRGQVLEYESDPQPQLTDDEDLSDDDLHFELNTSFNS